MSTRTESRPGPVQPFRWTDLSLRAAVALLLAVTACGPEVPGQEVLLRPHGDVLSAARVSDVREAVPGDVMIFGETTTFDGEAGGSAVAAGRDVEIRGRVDGSVRAAGATVSVHAVVGRNVTAAGGRVHLDRETVVAGNAFLAGGEVVMDGTVEGDLYLGAGSVLVNGVVGGDVRVEANTLRLGPDARIGGELRYRLDESGAFVPDASAEVTGSTRALTRREAEGPHFGVMVGRVLAFLLAGAVLVALMPGTLAALADPIGRRPGAAIGYGIVTMLVAPLAVVMLAATLIGIPLAVTALLLMGLAWYFAPVLPAVWLGRAMLGAEPTDAGTMLKAFLVGGAVVGLACVAPWIGFPAHLIAVAFGLGALGLSVRAHRESRL